MSYRLTYTVDADGTTRLEMECDPSHSSEVEVAEQVFLAALDRLSKVGHVGEPPIEVVDDGVMLRGSYAQPRWVECDRESHAGVATCALTHTENIPTRGTGK